MKREQGFTLVEVIIAIMVLTVGLLVLVNSSALVTRMIAQGQRSAVAATDAARILDSLRAVACTARNAGSAVVWRGAVPVDSLNWRYAADPQATNHWRLVLSSKYRTKQSQWRRDSMETYISCLL
jgi:prepilin-type N-terminal cleavage/methylation domain-containing protein